ncbi:MAG TPA: hypothetical protein VK750_09430 [Cytophagaceae bacterium]|jgi:hypothetical protein|nr:hypothetical protein [Cytophagaceae bacterium]
MRFLKIINEKTAILSGLDTERIYIENVRSFFNLPYRLAKFYCNMAVKQNYFEKSIGIMCPYCNRIILTMKDLNQVPEYLECEHCRELEKESYSFHPMDKDFIEIYKLNKDKI